jgi:hypothetical protein
VVILVEDVEYSIDDTLNVSEGPHQIQIQDLFVFDEVLGSVQNPGLFIADKFGLEVVSSKISDKFVADRVY